MGKPKSKSTNLKCRKVKECDNLKGRVSSVFNIGFVIFILLLSFRPVASPSPFQNEDTTIKPGIGFNGLSSILDHQEDDHKNVLKIFYSNGSYQILPLDHEGPWAFNTINTGTSTTTMIFVNNRQKIDQTLLNVTYLTQYGYLVDNKVRVIALVGEPFSSQSYLFSDLPSTCRNSVINGVSMLNGTTEPMYTPHLPLIAATMPYGKIFELASYASVAHIWLDVRYRVCLNESVPLIKDPVEWAKIETDYGYAINGSGVKIAILDTGIDWNHPDFFFPNGTSKVIANVSFVPGENAMDGFGHGTHCASIAAGTGEASGGKFKGVATEALLMDVKVLNNQGSGYDSWIIEGIQWAVDNGADVLSMSFGADMNDDGSDPLSLAVDWATDEGAICTVAAGNSGYWGTFTVGIPAVARKAITVGATTKTDEIADFSSQGPSADFRLKPDVCAPGVNIVAARANGTSMGTPLNNAYTMASGTSMATPHVAGAAALIIQAHTDWDPVMVKSALMGNSKMLAGERLWRQGAGRIDVAKATNTTLLIIEPNFSFGMLGLGDLANASLVILNVVNVSMSINVSSVTFCEGNETDYVTANVTSLTVPAYSNVSVLLNVGPLDDQAQEGWYEGWLNVTNSYVNLRAPYLFAALSTLTVSIFDLDDATAIDGNIVLTTYPNMSLVDFVSIDPDWDHWPSAEIFTKSGNYSVQAQCGYVYNGTWEPDWSRTFMLQKNVSIPKLSKLSITFRLAEERASEIPVESFTGKNLTIESYTQHLAGDPYFNSGWNITAMRWSIGMGWFGFELNATKLTFYSSDYNPAEKMSESFGYYAHDPLYSEVHLLAWKFWNVSSLPPEISYPTAELVKYNFYYDMPETYPEADLCMVYAFWFTWDYLGGMQGWAYGYPKVLAGINATVYMAPNVATYWGEYAMVYGGWNYLFGNDRGPLERWEIGRHSPPPQRAPKPGERGKRVFGNYDFGPYVPRLSINSTKVQTSHKVTLYGDVWSNLKSMYSGIDWLVHGEYERYWEWSFISGTWKWETDKYGFSWEEVLSGESGISEEAEAVAGDENWTDYKFFAAVKVVSGKSANLRFRVSNAGFYQLTIHPNENAIKLWKYNGSYSLMASANVTVEYGFWHFVEISARGPRINILFDSVSLDTTDDAFRKGKVGLGTWEGNSYFARVAVWHGWWPHLQWIRLSPSPGGPLSPYPQNLTFGEPYYYLYIDETLAANGTLGRINIDESLGLWWDNITESWNVTGEKALLELVMPSFATISQWTVYNISFSLSDENITIPPLFTSLYMSTTYSAGENLTIELETPGTISNISLRYSFDNGTTWQIAQLSSQKYLIPCQAADRLAILINATDVYGNSFQYFSSPAALCNNVRLRVPDRIFAHAGEPTTVFGNLTTIEGKGLKDIAVTLTNKEQTYASPNGNGSFSFTFTAPNATKTYMVTSPSVGVYDSTQAYFTLEILEISSVVIDETFVSDDRADVGSSQRIGFHAAWAESDFDVVGGSIYVNGTEYVTNGTGWISFEVVYNTVGKREWTVTDVLCYGATEYKQIVDDPYIIWDRVQISLSVDNRMDVGSNASVNWTGYYEYNGTTFTGSISLNDTLTKGAVGKYTYTVLNITDDNFDLTTFSTNTVQVIFDRIIVKEGGVSSSHSQVGSNQTVWLKAEYEYDSVRFDNTKGTLFLNGEPMTWSDANSRWEYPTTSDSIGAQTFQAASVNDETYQLTSIMDLVGEVSITWDRIEITKIEFDTTQLGVITVEVNVAFAYTQTAVANATVTVNGIKCTESSAGIYTCVIHTWNPFDRIRVQAYLPNFTPITETISTTHPMNAVFWYAIYVTACAIVALPIIILMFKRIFNKASL